MKKQGGAISHKISRILFRCRHCEGWNSVSVMFGKVIAVIDEGILKDEPVKHRKSKYERLIDENMRLTNAVKNLGFELDVLREGKEGLTSFNINDLKEYASKGALLQTGGNISEARKLVGVCRRTLQTWIREYALEEFVEFTCFKKVRLAANRKEECYAE